jgi:voltage-gated potassium channel
MDRKIAGLKDHYVVCGFGRIGNIICAELQRAGIEFVIIEKDPTLVQAADCLGYLVVEGDATSDTSLRAAGITKARGVIAVLNSDADNLFISLAAREMNPDIKIIARGEEPATENRLLRAGADVVVSPLKLGGQQIARMVLEGHARLEQPLIVS